MRRLKSSRCSRVDSSENLRFKSTFGLSDRLRFMIRKLAREPLEKVAKLCVPPKRAVVVKRSIFSTMQLELPSKDCDGDAGSPILTLSPMLKGFRSSMKRTPWRLVAIEGDVRTNCET